ncbi:MAG: acetolactate synthase small subunit [Candidatus Marinimicrobia bacterium]|nr:acetolactate synthase small subunit [Candidatus Neomarinimicrobiota bacterium]
MTTQRFVSGDDIHSLSAYVANKPGVLARIAQVFARRGFNIDSLVVSPGGTGDFSRMTITAKGNPEGLQQVIEQVGKLVDVLHCFDHTGQDVVVRELALVKLAVTPSERTEVLQVAAHFGAKTVDLTEESLTLMITGQSDKLDAMLGLATKWPLIELVRTGKVIMARGAAVT